MVLSWRTVSCEETVGLVVRPRPGGGPDQALILTREGGIYELEGAAGDGGGGPKLGTRLASWGSASSLVHNAYDPATGTVIFTPSLTSISKLDASNQVSSVAGAERHSWGMQADGVGAAARFSTITSLAADSRGGVWLADSNRIRRLDTRSGVVTTLAGVEVPCPWPNIVSALAQDPTAAGTLWAATTTAVCRVRTEGSGGVELVAGHWNERGKFDGSRTVAQFNGLGALLPVSGGRLLIADGPDLRCMDAGGAVTTLLRGCFPGGYVRRMALLPSGDLAVMQATGKLMLVRGGDFAPPAQLPSAVITDCSLGLPAAVEGAGGSAGGSMMAAPGATAGAGPAAGPSGAEARQSAGGSGSGSTSVLSGTVAVRVGDRAFHAHRSVLAAGSEYFARLLAPGGGFEGSGAAAVALPDADPAAFAHLLSYMYGTAVGYPGFPPSFVKEPPELLHATAALAGRLQIDGAVAALTERLAAAAQQPFPRKRPCTPHIITQLPEAHGAAEGAGASPSAAGPRRAGAPQAPVTGPALLQPAAAAALGDPQDAATNAQPTAALPVIKPDSDGPTLPPHPAAAATPAVIKPDPDGPWLRERYAQALTRPFDAAELDSLIRKFIGTGMERAEAGPQRHARAAKAAHYAPASLQYPRLWPHLKRLWEEAGGGSAGGPPSKRRREEADAAEFLQEAKARELLQVLRVLEVSQRLPGGHTSARDAALSMLLPPYRAFLAAERSAAAELVIKEGVDLTGEPEAETVDMEREGGGEGDGGPEVERPERVGDRGERLEGVRVKQEPA